MIRIVKLTGKYYGYPLSDDPDKVMEELSDFTGNGDPVIIVEELDDLAGIDIDPDDVEMV